MYEEFSKIFSNLALLHKSLRNSEVSFFPLKKTRHAWESNHELSNAVLAQYHIVKIRIAACRLIYVKYNKDKFYFIEQILESDMTDSSK